METQEFLIRLFVALCLGAAIGAERQVSRHLAGLKTNALVAVGAALFMVVGASLPGEGYARLGAQIITGIGFLGGGVILRDGFHVRGLNTAATLWCAAAVGTLSGTGLLMQAAVGTVAVLIVNVGLRPLSERIGEEGFYGMGHVSAYQLQLICRFESESAVRSAMVDLAGKAKLQLKGLKTEIAGTDMLSIQAELVPFGKNGAHLEDLVQMVSGFEGVSSVEWKSLL